MPTVSSEELGAYYAAKAGPGALRPQSASGAGELAARRTLFRRLDAVATVAALGACSTWEPAAATSASVLDARGWEVVGVTSRAAAAPSPASAAWTR